MTAWFSKIYWRLRGRRWVRVQYKNNQGAVDGILIGTIAGHYRIVNATFIPQNGQIKPVDMTGEAWIPKIEVMMINVKSNLTPVT